MLDQVNNNNNICLKSNIQTSSVDYAVKVLSNGWVCVYCCHGCSIMYNKKRFTIRDSYVNAVVEQPMKQI